MIHSQNIDKLSIAEFLSYCQYYVVQIFLVYFFSTSWIFFTNEYINGDFLGGFGIDELLWYKVIIVYVMDDLHVIAHAIECV